MPTATIPLVGQITQRNFATISSFSKDQSFRGVVINAFTNPLTGQRTAYCEKRTGWSINATVSAGNIGTAIWLSPSTAFDITAFGSSTSTLFRSTTNCGTLTANHIARHITETIISGTTYYLISAVDITSRTSTSGWYLASDAHSQTSYTGTLTIGSAVVPSIASTAGMYAGQAISGTGIPASTTILTVDSATQITMSAVATANGAQTITKTPVAKIIDANFPSSIVGQFVELDGYVFIMDQNGKIWNSAVNTVATWSALGFKSADTFSDGGVGLAKVGHQIIGFGTTSAEFFYNAGYATGSPLEKTKQVLPVGACLAASPPFFQSLMTDHSGVVAWIAQPGGTTGAQVHALIGGAVKKISTPAIDAIVSAQGIINISAWDKLGHKFIHISKATAINLLYCVDLDLWMDGNFSDAYLTVGNNSAVNGGGGGVWAIEGILTNGRTYILSGNTYLDSGSAFNSIVQTSRITHGTDNRKFVSDISLLADDQSSGTVTLECSDDDYGSWVTLGTFDLTLHKKKITRCGSYKGGRAYRLTHSTAAAFRWEALQINYTVGTN